jgi:pterin-4a-carbinolamine dehydratase
MRRVCAWLPVVNHLGRFKGDYGMNVLHHGNPQHGAAYAQMEKKMSDEEVEDFLKSVKGWKHDGETDMIAKTFKFETFALAYDFMGRLFAFCWHSDKYPPISWQGKAVTVELYSPKFKGISKREARIAAFCNDQFNIQKKSKKQAKQLQEMAGGSVVKSVIDKSTHM